MKLQELLNEKYCGVCDVKLSKGRCGCKDNPHRKEYLEIAKRKNDKKLRDKK